MSKYFKPDTALGMEAECAVCCCVWSQPVELLPCQHIFCKACVATLDTCPTCCGAIELTRPPNNALLRMLQRTPGCCSACEWKGTLHDFNELHKTCWVNGQPAPVGEASSGQFDLRTTSSGAMEEYFMEDVPSRKQQQPGGPSVSSASAKADQSTSTLEAWKRQQRGLSRQRGLYQDEYEALVDKFAEMATARTDSGEPALTWRDACRFLRFFNCPNHPDDVRDLFFSAGQSTETGYIVFHELCKWIPLNRRSPQQWYGMPTDAYKSLLMMALLLDEGATGLFTLDQARLLAEQYFERDVPDSEWDVIGPMVRERAHLLRQAFPDEVADVSGQNSQELKLPFHDVLLSFMRYVDMMKRRQTTNRANSSHTGALTSAPLTLEQRIYNLVKYYDPSAVPTLPQTLQNFQGEEADLLMTFVAMYGPEPVR